MIIAAFVAVGLIFNLVVILLIRQRRKVNEMIPFILIHLSNYGEQSSRSIQDYLRELGYRFSLTTFHAIMSTLINNGQVKGSFRMFCKSDGKPHPPYEDGQGYLIISFYRLAKDLPKRQANQK